MMERFDLTKIVLFLVFLNYLVVVAIQAVDEELETEIRLARVNLYELSTLPGGRKTRAAAADRRLDIYCYPGISKRDLWRIWTSYTLRLIMPTEFYVVYVGSNRSEVYRQHRDATSSWITRFMPWRTDNVPLAVFNKTCVGVGTMEGYTVHLYQKAVDPWIVGYLITGLLLFFSAKRLSRNFMFYYGTGVGFGLLASLLILVFILSRFMPKKYGAMAVLVGGWSLTLWFLQYMWENIQKILENYIEYVTGYFVVTTVITWAILYYKGPVTNPRLINLIKWALQLVALVLVYMGTQIQEVSITLIAILLLTQVIPRPSSVFGGTKMSHNYTFWWRWVPRLVPKPKLLTEDEYLAQGREETRKALAELRGFCRSPDCNAWKTLSRLNSPQRFATFIEGGSHLSDDELYAFDHERPTMTWEDSDESEMEFQLNSQ